MIILNKEDNSNQYLDGNVFDIQDNKFSEVGNFFLEQEKKFYTINLKNTLKTVGKNIDENFDIETTMEKSNLIENEIGNNTIEKNEIEEKELIEFDKMSIDSIDYSDEFGQILERITNYIKKKFGRYEEGDLIDNVPDSLEVGKYVVHCVGSGFQE